MPMDGGGWLVTFRHDAAETELLGGGVDMREVRLAVMKSQFGWGAYAVCEYRAEERLGWYEGEEVTVDEWKGLGKREGREHTVRVSWAGNGRTPCINGIDGVAGMQYLNTAYGREEREKDTGVPEYTEKMTFKYNMRGGIARLWCA